MDVLPWDSDAIQQVLDANGIPYDRRRLGRPPVTRPVRLSARSTSATTSRSPSMTSLFANEDKLTALRQRRRFLWFGAAAFGFQDGDLDGAVLPGGLTVHGPDYQDQNTVEAPTHPLMAGMPDPFNGTSASHVTFSDLPAGATVIAATPSGDPTLVDYDLGSRSHRRRRPTRRIRASPTARTRRSSSRTACRSPRTTTRSRTCRGCPRHRSTGRSPPTDRSTSPCRSTPPASSLACTRASVLIRTNDPDHEQVRRAGHPHRPGLPAGRQCRRQGVRRA